MDKTLEIEVPASSANLGVGFDCLGLALNLYARFSFAKSDSLSISGCDPKFQGEDNLVWQSYLSTCKLLGHSSHPALSIHIDSPIPLSGGLGSSSCCIVAGVIAAELLHSTQKDFDLEQTFEIAAAIEGHPDNIAPAVFGGLVATFSDGQNFIPIKQTLSSDLHYVIVAPPYEVRTEHARKVLPKEIDFSTAIWQSSHIVALLQALKAADTKLLSVACVDKLHEPYRKSLIPDFDRCKEVALKAGAASFVISGSGSSMLALCTDKSVAQKVENALQKIATDTLSGAEIFLLEAGSGASARFF